jgi:hypothetical protein
MQLSWIFLSYISKLYSRDIAKLNSHFLFSNLKITFSEFLNLLKLSILGM